MPLRKDGDKQKLNCVVTKAQYADIQNAAKKNRLLCQYDCTNGSCRLDPVA